MIKEPDTAKTYTTVYSDFKGVDLTSAKNEVYKRRSPDSVNMIPDLDGTPHKRYGFRDKFAMEPSGNTEDSCNIKEMRVIKMKNGTKQSDVSFTVSTINEGYDTVVTAWVDFKPAQETTIVSYYAATNFMPTLETLFTYKDEVYYLDVSNEKLLKLTIANNKVVATEVTPKTPVITIGRKPTGGGTPYEPVNLLTDEVRETFLGDGTSKDYYTSFPIDEIKMVSYKNSSGNYIATSNYTLSEDKTHITFTTAHAPIVEGEDNVSIRYKKQTTDSTELMRKTFMSSYQNEVFGTGATTRVMLTGAYYTWTRKRDNRPDLPDTTYCDRVWYSEPDNITYFPDTNYFVVPNKNICGMVGANDYIYIFRTDGVVHLFQPTTFDNEATFVIRKTIDTNATIIPNTLRVFNGEPIFFSPEKGICTIETSDSEVKTKSHYINKELLKTFSRNNGMILDAFQSAIVWGDFYIMPAGRFLYLLDGTQKSSWVNDKTNFQYECYKWEFNYLANQGTVLLTSVCDDNLYFAEHYDTTLRMYDTTCKKDSGLPFTCSWTTIFDDDGLANYFKNMQKKNCVVTLAPADSTNVKIYVKVDDADFELVYEGAFTNSGRDTTAPIDIYLNKKFKKYKRLQFKVTSDTEGTFGIQQIIKMYTIGGFSK